MLIDGVRLATHRFFTQTPTSENEGESDSARCVRQVLAGSREGAALKAELLYTVSAVTAVEIRGV